VWLAFGGILDYRPPCLDVLSNEVLHEVSASKTLSLTLPPHRGHEAASEFRKFVDRRGLIANRPLGALTHLGLGRAYPMTGDTAKAKVAYLDLLTRWKDADPDISILKQAKGEYAKLQ